MPARRDPLSEHYDSSARRNLLAALNNRPRAQEVWVGSPAPEFRDLDRGGRTRHERAFTRSAYYITQRLPLREGRQPDWSLKITWSPIYNHRGRWGRVAKLRLYRRSSARSPLPGRSWRDDASQRSAIGARVDGADTQ